MCTHVSDEQCQLNDHFRLCTKSSPALHLESDCPLVGRKRYLVRMAIHERTEPFPRLAGEAHHLELLDRAKVRRRCLDPDAGNIGCTLDIEVRRHLHDPLAREIVATAPQHLNERARHIECHQRAAFGSICVRIVFRHERAKVLHGRV